MFLFSQRFRSVEKNKIFIKIVSVLALFGLLFLLPFATQSRDVPLSDEERKLFTSLRITPASLWIRAQDFSGELPNGETMRLQDYEGRFVLLNFWATWCSPCLKEMPDMEKAYQKLGPEKLVVLAVGMGEDTERISRFVKKYGFTFPLVADPKMEITRLYGVRNIPVTYLVNPQGVILGRALGVRNWANPELLAFFEARPD